MSRRMTLRIVLLCVVAVLLLGSSNAFAYTYYIDSTFNFSHGPDWFIGNNWTPRNPPYYSVPWNHYYGGDLFRFDVTLPAPILSMDMSVEFTDLSYEYYIDSLIIGEDTGTYKTTFEFHGDTPLPFHILNGTTVNEKGVFSIEYRFLDSDIVNEGLLTGFGFVTGEVENSSTGTIRAAGPSGDQ